jgi:hypothetical protein
MNPSTYTSFLVRIWEDTGTTPTTIACRVEIEHIQSGQKQHFDSLDQAFDFLHRQVHPSESITLPQRNC